MRHGQIVLIANLPVSALETGQPLFIEKIYKQRGILLKGLSFLPTTIGYSIDGVQLSWKNVQERKFSLTLSKGSNFIGRFFDWFGGNFFLINILCINNRRFYGIWSLQRQPAGVGLQKFFKDWWQRQLLE